MSDEFGRQIGLSDADLAHLDQLAQLWPNRPPAAISEPAGPDEWPLAAARGIVYGCAVTLLVAVVLAVIGVVLAATSAPPAHLPAPTATNLLE